MFSKRKIFWGIASFYFFSLIAISILTTVLPVYMYAMNYSETEIGLTIGVASFVGVVFTPIWGIIEDKYKRASDFLLVILVVLSFVALSFGVIESFIVFLIARSFFELFLCGLFPLIDKTAIEVEHRLAIPYPRMRAFGSLSYAIALFPVLVLIERYNNYMVAFICMFVASLIGALSTRFFRSMDQRSKRPSTREADELHLGFAQALRQLANNRNYWLIIGMYMLLFGANEVSSSLQGIHLEKSLMAPSFVLSLAVFIAAGVVEVPMMFASIRLHKRWGWVRCVCIAILLLMCRYLIEVFATNWQFFLLAKVFQGMSVPLLLSPILMLTRRHVSLEIFATAVTLLAASKGLMTAIMSPTVSSMNAYFGTTYAMYVVFLGMTAVAFLFFIIYFHSNRIRSIK